MSRTTDTLQQTDTLQPLTEFILGHAERVARIRAELVRQFGETRADEILGKNTQWTDLRPGEEPVATGERRYPHAGEYYRVAGSTLVLCNDDIETDWRYPASFYEIVSVRRG